MPAASSEALLIRLPDANRSIDCSRSRLFSDKILDAVVEELLVLITTAIGHSIIKKSFGA